MSSANRFCGPWPPGVFQLLLHGLAVESGFRVWGLGLMGSGLSRESIGNPANAGTP